MMQLSTSNMQICCISSCSFYLMFNTLPYFRQLLFLKLSITTVDEWSLFFFLDCMYIMASNTQYYSTHL